MLYSPSTCEENLKPTIWQADSDAPGTRLIATSRPSVASRKDATTPSPHAAKEINAFHLIVANSVQVLCILRIDTLHRCKA